MDFVPETIGERYVDLALSLEQHIPGYIDSYYGPVDWKDSVQKRGLVPLEQLEKNAQELAQDIERSADIDAQRKDFLSREVRAMQTTLRRLQGEQLSLVEEVEGIYDITPVWTDEGVFEEAHQALDELLPAGENIQERMSFLDHTLEIPKTQIEPLIPFVIDFLRQKTRERYILPVQETFKLSFVSNQPWSAYHRYLGNFHSRIEINTDFPYYITRITPLLAHEGYPGHHTELSNKEFRLYKQAGYTEVCLTLINAPSCVVSEGIANISINALLTEEEQVSWLEELFLRAGFDHLDSKKQRRIMEASQNLVGVRSNAAFLLHEQRVDKREVQDYIQKYELVSEIRAKKAVDFITDPLLRSYVFTYEYGTKLIKPLLEKKESRKEWFTRLLTEPVTPHQIRAWVEAERFSGI